MEMVDMTSAVEKRATVLLVEDEPQICNIAVEALEEQGFEVEAVANAGEALRRLTSGLPVEHPVHGREPARRHGRRRAGAAGARAAAQSSGDLHLRPAHRD